MDDSYFGRLQWNIEDQEWEGTTFIPPHGEIDVDLPPEYVESHEIQDHIRKTMDIIKRDERGFREKASNELFTEGGYRLFLIDNEQFEHERFVNEMYLAGISFSTYFPKTPLTLFYEFSEEGMEHGIIVHLTWEGMYQDARVY